METTTMSSMVVLRADEGMIVCKRAFFFFQAEDGIRDLTVTGVQTCALPICKPGVKLFRDSKDALGIDLQRSYWVGDRLSDVVPARALGAGTAHGILVATGHGARYRAQAEALGMVLVPDLAAAVDRIVQGK